MCHPGEFPQGYGELHQPLRQRNRVVQLKNLSWEDSELMSEPFDYQIQITEGHPSNSKSLLHGNNRSTVSQSNVFIPIAPSCTDFLSSLPTGLFLPPAALALQQSALSSN